MQPETTPCTLFSLFTELQKYRMLGYLSSEMAMRVKTLAATVVDEMKLLRVQ